MLPASDAVVVDGFDTELLNCGGDSAAIDDGVDIDFSASINVDGRWFVFEFVVLLGLEVEVVVVFVVVEVPFVLVPINRLAKCRFIR